MMIFVLVSVYIVKLYGQVTITDGVLAYYPLDITNQFNDYTGNGNDLTAMNAPQYTADRFGNPNSAVYLENNAHAIGDTSFGALLNGDLSISAWFKTNYGECLVSIGSSHAGTPDNKQYAVMIRNDGVQVHGGGTGNNKVFTLSSSYFGNTWNHIVITKNGDNGKLYINSVYIGDYTHTFDIGNYNQQNIIIGSWNEYTNYFTGYIDELIIWDKVLTQDMVNKVYTYGLYTDVPTSVTNSPSITPTLSPSIPTNVPTLMPTVNPTNTPTNNPSTPPTLNPTVNPTVNPTNMPSISPTLNPTMPPTTGNPSVTPTINPTLNPSVPPTFYPTKPPTLKPTYDPIGVPTAFKYIEKVVPTQYNVLINITFLEICYIDINRDGTKKEEFYNAFENIQPICVVNINDVECILSNMEQISCINNNLQIYSDGFQVNISIALKTSKYESRINDILSDTDQIKIAYQSELQKLLHSNAITVGDILLDTDGYNDVTNNKHESKEKKSVWFYVGIIGGTVGGVVIIIISIFLYIKKSNHKQKIEIKEDKQTTSPSIELIQKVNLSPQYSKNTPNTQKKKVNTAKGGSFWDSLMKNKAVKEGLESRDEYADFEDDDELQFFPIKKNKH